MVLEASLSKGKQGFLTLYIVQPLSVETVSAERTSCRMGTFIWKKMQVRTVPMCILKAEWFLLFCGMSDSGGLPRDGVSSGLSIKGSSVVLVVIPKDQSMIPTILGTVLFPWKYKKFLIIFCSYHSHLHQNFFAKLNTDSQSSGVSNG